MPTFSPRHRFADWPNPDIPAVAAGVYAIWDEDPTAWAPMNHSCAPNTGYRGLDVVALRAIAAGEELTLDYALMLNEHSASFTCQCGAPTCRGTVQGRPGTTIGRPSR